MPITSLRSAFPVLKNPANIHRTVALTPEQFRYGFGNAIPEDESDQLWERWTIPSPGRPIFQSATANLTPHSQAAVDTHNHDRGPLLLIAGGQDHTVPEAITTSTLKQYRHSDATTELLELADRGHSLVIDHGWTDVADACLAWLAGRDPQGSSRSGRGRTPRRASTPGDNATAAGSRWPADNAGSRRRGSVRYRVRAGQPVQSSRPRRVRSAGVRSAA